MDKKKNFVKLPTSVVNYYSKYKNKKKNIKTQVIMGTKFEIEDRYEIIDASLK